MRAGGGNGSEGVTVGGAAGGGGCGAADRRHAQCSPMRGAARCDAVWHVAVDRRAMLGWGGGWELKEGSSRGGDRGGGIDRATHSGRREGGGGRRPVDPPAALVESHHCAIILSASSAFAAIQGTTVARIDTCRSGCGTRSSDHW